VDRTFTHGTAKREGVPLLIGTVGPSGSGKTMSALRLATGMQRVVGGKTFFVDTENKRALHYADQFEFEHVPFEPPFSPLDYLAIIQYCKKQGATTVIVDSMSHEHEGPGGLLEMHDAELDRLAGKDYKKRDRVAMLAWAKPKAQRRRLINEVVRMGVNAIFCFRAKEKIKLVKGEKQPLQLGWQPIAGDEFVYEMTVNCLLYPGSNGVPTWAAEHRAETVMIKDPGYLSHIFKRGEPLSEDIGEALALWAQGETYEPTEEFTEAVFDLRAATDRGELDAATAKVAEGKWSASETKVLRELVTSRRKELAEGQ